MGSTVKKQTKETVTRGSARASVAGACSRGASRRRSRVASRLGGYGSTGSATGCKRAESGEAFPSAATVGRGSRIWSRFCAPGSKPRLISPCPRCRSGWPNKAFRSRSVPCGTS